MTIEALNGVCPYYTMYPLAFPLGVLERNGKPGDHVLDPFCGRGTTNFAARLLRMPSFGIDSSPVAIALARSKLVAGAPASIVSCAREILAEGGPLELPQGEFWNWAFHPDTLIDVCRLREALRRSSSSPTRILLRAIALGALHGPQPKGLPSYFSNQAPRTFAPKPRYAVRFWRERNLIPKKVDVVAVIARRATRYLSVQPPVVEGVANLADSREDSAFAGVPSVDWIITSPPYYGMRTYIPDQWLRSWFLGGPDTVQYLRPQTQLEHSGAAHFSEQLKRVWMHAAARARRGARLVIRFGGIHDRDAEPIDILRASLSGAGWRITTTRAVADADMGRRQVRQFHAKPRKPIAEVDVYCRPS